MVKIAPSILSADFSMLGEELKKVERAGADLIHVDVMDGHFVPNITIGPPVIKSLRKATSLPLDVHLMIDNPDKYILEFVKAGSDFLTVHVETCTHLHRTVQSIKEQGIKVGVALNPATSLSFLDHILSDIDMVLLMSVNPGFGGQKFIENILSKISKLKEIIQKENLNVDIGIDGGVKVENISEIVKAGANMIVAGSAVFHSKDYKEVIEKMRMKINLTV